MNMKVYTVHLVNRFGLRDKQQKITVLIADVE